MDGLLSNWGQWSGDDDKNAAIRQGLLTAGLQMMASRGSLGQAIGQGGLAGVNQYGDAMKQARDDKMRELQTKMLQQQFQQQQRATERQALLQTLPQQFMRTPGQQAMTDGAAAGSLGPTNANATRMQATPEGGFDFAAYADALAQYDPQGSIAMKASMRKDTTPIKLGPGDMLINPQSFKPLANNPKVDEQPNAVREYQFAKQQGYGGTFEQWDTARKRAGASNVSVNTGQKGIENELKLRDDMRSEPIYKAHNEVRSAYAQIQQGLTMKSPAGDLAAATKIMKLLDPGSVVRESELGMAMAATGLMDRVTNYASNIMAGTKLTPNQRADFEKLANALYSESAKQYNAKRTEYGAFAKDWGLNADRVAGQPAALPAASADGWSITPVGPRK